MRFGKITLLGALVFAFSANAQDVMVDLDVLNDLENPYVEDAKPLFPIFTPKAVIKVKKKTSRSPKKTVKKIETLKPKVKDASPKLEENLEKTLPSISIDDIKPLDDEAVVVDVEPVSSPVPVDEKAKIVEEPEVVIPAKEENKVEEALVTNDTREVNTQNNTVLSLPQNDKKSTEENGGLIVDEVKTIAQPSDSIKFDDGVDVLSDEHMAKIDSIVLKYQNGPKNKIAIYSYNLDDGVDSFKKKRVSLNRAVEVRSYLLKKGYKNFSIKVVNINSPSDKLNIVELQEI